MTGLARNVMQPHLTLVLGGVRSGKSAFAEEMAGRWGQSVLYLATGQSTDADMAQRIRRHRERRPATWQTLEESLHPADALATALASGTRPDALLLDSVDVWVANILLSKEDEDSETVEKLALAEVDALVEAGNRAGVPTVLVSSEVGLSPVPPNRLGRQFQDLLGTVNQQVAAAADAVYLVVAGLPVRVKPQ